MYHYDHSDPVIICPYDSNHKIAKSRIQKHLVKCEKNFPPGYKQQCPYDASHRLFEEEMINHVESCPMKFAFESSCSQLGRLPEIDTELESLIDNDEVWDGGDAAPNTGNPFNEPIFETIRPPGTASLRGNAMIVKRYHSQLRRPQGFPKSMMLEINNQDFNDDDDNDDRQSVSSDMAVGRGQAIMMSLRGSARGNNLRRGLRGRLLH